MFDPNQYTDDTAAYTCRRCQRRVLSLEFDGEHEESGAELDATRQREAIKRLHRDRAALLRRVGCHEEAAYHELLAGGR